MPVPVSGPATVLIIDDDPIQRRLLEAQVARMGLRSVTCDSGGAGLQALGRESFSVVVLDLVMPGLGGLDVLQEMRRLSRIPPVIVQTAKGGIDTVVEAMRAGAFDFVVKPVPPEKIERAIANAIRVGEARSRQRSGRHPSPRTPEPAASRLLPGQGLAGPAMRPALSLAAKASVSGIPVLIEGETGVGKEWLAEAIRAAGPRAAAPFVVVNCGALPVQLVESILFGHEKGAFTDAGERRDGKFVEANGGTLLLDEVGELAPEVQVKLLRVLQKGEVDPVGGRGPVAVDVRIVSATHRDLSADVAAGRFREDLYYRLNVLAIRMPPLRERRAEIAGLAAGFIERFATIEAGTPARRLSPGALGLLEAYDWPGNIRQLENAIHRAVVLAESETLGIADFPQVAAFIQGSGNLADGAFGAGPVHAQGVMEHLRRGGWETEAPERTGQEAAIFTERTDALAAFDAAGEVRTADAVEADLIRLAMVHYAGHMSEIARRLGIGRSTLYRKMRRYSIVGPHDQHSHEEWEGDPEPAAQTLPQAPGGRRPT